MRDRGAVRRVYDVGTSMTAAEERVDPTRVAVRVEPWSRFLESEWEELAQSSGTHPFAHPGWTRAWSETSRSGAMPPLLAARREGALVGALPVVASCGVVRSGTHSETPVFEPAAADEGVVQAMADAAVRIPRRQMDLSYLWSDSPFTCALRQVAAERGLPVAEQLHGRSPYVDTTRTWEEFEQRLSAKRRQESRRKRRRLGERGQLTFEVADGRVDNLACLLDEGFEAEGSGWKSQAGTSVNSRPAVRESFTRAAQWASSAGRLRLAFLRLDGCVVAFSYMLFGSRVLYGVKIGYDPGFERFSPGWLLAMHVVEHACRDETVDRLEMLGASDLYKMSIADGARDRVRLVAFTNPWTARAERRALLTGMALQRRLSNRLPRSWWAPFKDLRDRAHGLRV